MTQDQKNFIEYRDKTLMGGGADKIARQHAKGKLTARERLDYLFDKGTFIEYGLFAQHNIHGFGQDKEDLPYDGVVTGCGKINGRLVYAYAEDFTVKGGSLGLRHGQKMVRVIREADQVGAPLVGLNDGAGGRMTDINNQYIHVFDANVECSGRIPQVSAVMGTCGGGSAYCPALTDFIITVDKTSTMFICGPQAVKTVTGQDVDVQTLGGAAIHNTTSGVSHCMAKDDYECLDKIKLYLSYFPQNYKEKPPVYICSQNPDDDIMELDDILPESEKRPYDMHRIIDLIVDKDSVFEIQPDYAKNVITALCRLNGRSVGIVANQPMVLAGCIDINASDKMAHFINLCNSFNIPLVYLEDQPGYMPGVDQEHGGIIRHGAKVLYANAMATVPKINIGIRKCYGGGNAAMAWSHGLKTDAVLSWPSAVTSTMGTKQTVEISFKKELDQAEDRAKREAELIEEYDRVFNKYVYAQHLMVDAFIMPHETRKVLIQLLERYENKEYKVSDRRQGIMPV